MKYNDKIIKHMNLEYMYDLLFPILKISPEIMDNSYESICERVTIENFILKYIYDEKYRELYNNPTLSLNIARYVSDYYGFLSKRPEIYLDSLFAKNENINRLCPDELVDTINNILSKDNILSKFNLIMREEANYPERDLVSKYLALYINSDDCDINYMVDSYVRKIINDNHRIDKYSNGELKLLGSYLNKWINSITGKNINNSIFIGSKENMFGGVYFDNTIIINKNMYKQDLPTLVYATIHEIVHSIQDDDSLNEINKRGFYFALWNLLRDNLSDDDYDIYRKNYRVSEPEYDAISTGYIYASILYSNFGLHNISNKLLRDRKEELKKRHFEFDFIKDEDSKNIKQIYMYDKLRQIICENEEIESPAIKKLIIDGHLMEFTDLIKYDYKWEDSFKNGVINSLIIKGIYDKELDNINLNLFNVWEKANIFNRLINCIEIEKRKINNIINSNINDGELYIGGDYITNFGNIFDEDMKYVTAAHINIFSNIANYLSDNKDSFLFLSKYNLLDNDSNVINNISKFNDEDINNLNVFDKSKKKLLNSSKLLNKTYKEDNPKVKRKI